VKTFLLASLFLAFVMVSAQARVGEDLPALISRYGQPLPPADQKPALDKNGSGRETFQRNGFQIDAVLVNGESAQESFKKINGDAFTTQEVDTLLADNSGGRAWQAPQTDGGQSKWLRDDGSTATLSDNHVLKITSGALLGLEARAQQLEKTPSLEGF
jgi:hypothetical protein